MKSSAKLFSSIIVALFCLSSCEKQAEEVIPETNSAAAEMFSKYIAVGGSLSAGFTNGGLYREGQLTSYPNLIAQQATIKFDQALFSVEQENGTGFLTTSTKNTTTVFDKIIDKSGIIATNPLVFAKYTGTLNDYGIADLRMSDMGKTGLGNVKKQGFNPYYERILPAQKEDFSYPDIIKESNATFFTVSIGEHDMLDFAISGGQKSLTETSVFAINCQKLLDALVANKSQGIITNLPNILDYPYFNFYTFAELAQNQGVSGIYITTGNGIVRLATANDKILMNAIVNVGKNNAGQKKGLTMEYPLNNEEVLDKDEINAVASSLSNFNGILKFEAEKRALTFFDLNNLYVQINSKTYSENGAKFDKSIMTGNFYSLDGINPTPRGSAVIANAIIKIINEKYKNSLKTMIPTLDVSKFEGLKSK